MASYLLQDPPPDAALIRQRAMPLIEQYPTRMPDQLTSGDGLAPLNWLDDFLYLPEGPLKRTTVSTFST
jgi:hypothetical protein